MMNSSVRRFYELLGLLNGIPSQIALCFKGRNTLYLLSVKNRCDDHSGPLQTHQLLDWFSLIVQFWLAISTESHPCLFPDPVLNLCRFLPSPAILALALACTSSSEDR